MRNVELLEPEHGEPAPRRVIDRGAAHAADADDDEVVSHVIVRYCVRFELQAYNRVNKVRSEDLHERAGSYPSPERGGCRAKRGGWGGQIDPHPARCARHPLPAGEG